MPQNILWMRTDSQCDRKTVIVGNYRYCYKTIMRHLCESKHIHNHDSSILSSIIQLFHNPSLLCRNHLDTMYIRCLANLHVSFIDKQGMTVFIQIWYLHLTHFVSCNQDKNKHKCLYSTMSNHQDCSNCFTLYSLADLFNWTQSWLLWEASRHAAINAQRLFIQISTNILYIIRYSFTHLGELELCGVNKFAQGFYRIWTQVLLVESRKLYPWASALLHQQQWLTLYSGTKPSVMLSLSLI